MNWLLQGLIEPGLQLTPQQQTAVRHRATSLFQSRRWGTLAMMVPGLMPLLLIPFWKWLAGFGFTFSVKFLVACGIMLIWAVVFGWFLRTVYARFVRRAVRELEYAELCLGCGYWLRGLDNGGDQVACPECGLERIIGQ